MKGRLIVYGLAAAAGVALALPFDRRAPAEAKDVAPSARSAPAVEEPATSVVHNVVGNVAAPVPSVRASSRLYASQGLELEALHADGAFVGYVVIRSHDARLSVDDVVTAVGGEPVEEGAAGSELLIAALRNPDAELTLRQKSDWSPEL